MHTPNKVLFSIALLIFGSGPVAPAAVFSADSPQSVARLQEAFDASPAQKKALYAEVIRLGGPDTAPDSLARLARAVALLQQSMDAEDELVDEMTRSAPGISRVPFQAPAFIGDSRLAAEEIGSLVPVFPFASAYEAYALAVAAHWQDGRALLEASHRYAQRFPLSRFGRRLYLLAGCRLLLDRNYALARESFEALWRESPASGQALDAFQLAYKLNGAGGLKLSADEMLAWAATQGRNGHNQLLDVIKRFPRTPECERAYLLIFRNFNNGFSARTLSRNRSLAAQLDRHYDQFSGQFPQSEYLPEVLLLYSEFNYRCGKRCQAISRKNDYSWRHYKNQSRRRTAGTYGGYAAGHFSRVTQVDSICIKRLDGTPVFFRAALNYALSLVEEDRYAEALGRLALLLSNRPPAELETLIASWAGLLYYHEGRFQAADDLLSKYEDQSRSAHEGWKRLMLFLGKSRLALGDKSRAALALATLARISPYGYHGIRARALKDGLIEETIPFWISSLPVIALPRFPDTLSTVGREVDETARHWQELGFFAEAAYVYSHGLSLAPDDLLLRFRLHENYYRAGWFHRILLNFRGPFNDFLLSGGRGLPENFWRVAYPNPPANVELIVAEGARRGIPPGLITAVIRQESNFHPRAKSHAGAVGLMQLLPTVGRRLSSGMGLGQLTVSRLYEPEVNIKLGVKFLAGNLARYEGNIALAISSYNADPRNLPAWIERSHPAGIKEDFDLDLFIELIPLEETYNYNLQVLTNFWRYQELGGEHKDLFNWKLLQFSPVKNIDSGN
ncbi:MAG: lytic transglycosylase domain-containing protein [Candidatus Glassbacteria bacterium]